MFLGQTPDISKSDITNIRLQRSQGLLHKATILLRLLGLLFFNIQLNSCSVNLACVSGSREVINIEVGNYEVLSVQASVEVPWSS